MIRASAVRWTVDALLAITSFLIDGLAWHPSSEPSGFDLTNEVYGAPLLSALAAVTLLFRRFIPVISYAAFFLFGLMPLAWPNMQPFVGLFVCLYTVASSQPGTRAGIVLASASLPLGLNALHTAEGASENLPIAFAFAAAIWALAGGTCWGFGRVISAAQRRAEQREADHAEETAELLRSERLRIARELHDILAHSISAMIVQAGGAKAISANSNRRVEEALASIETAGKQAMRELHRLLALIRTDDGDASEPVAQVTLQSADLLIRTTQACGIDLRYVVHGQPSALDPSIELAGYRILQEALTNVIKFGGEGARAEAIIHWTSEAVEITVWNDHVHSKTPSAGLSGGLGLRGLRERVSIIGGHLTAGPFGDGQYKVSAVLPITALPAPGQQDDVDQGTEAR